PGGAHPWRPAEPPYVPARRHGRPRSAQPRGRRAARVCGPLTMITTHALTKRYGRVTAIDGVDLHVREGDRYGLLGPNGSGKTTLLRLVLGLVYATSGSIELIGCPVPRRLAQV